MSIPVEIQPHVLSLVVALMTFLDKSSVVIPFFVSQNFTDEMGPSINLENDSQNLLMG